MSQSPSLTAALEAVERVLNAETGDLKKLAEVAGVLPSDLYLGADLTNVDLRRQDISFLLPLNTQFERAILTDLQLRAFRRAQREVVRLRVRRKIREIRIEAITQFIESYDSKRSPLLDVGQNTLLTAAHLKAILLAPVVRSYRADRSLDVEYTHNALTQLVPWVATDHFLFFRGLFELLAEIRSPVGRNTESILAAHYANPFGINLGVLIGAFYPTPELDRYWIVRAETGGRLAAAQQIGAMRTVHVAAVVQAVELTQGWADILTFLTALPFDCDTEQAERVALSLTKKDWPSHYTHNILEARVQPKVRNAIFRHLLAGGAEERIAEVIRWLDDNRGAAGALSLENAFVHIKDFDLGLKLANDISPHLADNQLKVIDSALSSLAYKAEDRARLSEFRKTWKFSRTARW